MKKITYEEFKENGKRVVRIPLKDDDYAVLYAEDWNLLREFGVGKLRKGPNDHIIASCKTANNGYVLVSRVLLGAKENESVRFADKNPHNLRKNNLKLVWDARGNLTNSRDIVLSSINAKYLEAV